MRPAVPPPVAAALLAAAAALSAEMSWLHARAEGISGVICGGAELVHCGWCVAAAGFALAAVGVLARPALSRLAARR